MIEPDALPPIILPEPASSNSGAPMLPIEGPIVSAAISAMEAKQKAEWLVFALQHHPRDRSNVEQAFRETQLAMNAAWAAWVNYVQVFDCKGQA